MILAGTRLCRCRHARRPVLGPWRRVGLAVGVCGMLLSIPIIVIVKVVSQHVEQLQLVAEL
jgi:hypothetical protein